MLNKEVKNVYEEPKLIDLQSKVVQGACYSGPSDGDVCEDGGGGEIGGAHGDGVCFDGAGASLGCSVGDNG
ncbi:MAG: hypothetical protein ABIH50_02910 [bacterium]